MAISNSNAAATTASQAWAGTEMSPLFLP